MTVEYLEFEAPNASDAELTEFFTFRDIMFGEFEKDDPLPPLELRIKSIRDTMSLVKSHRYSAKKDGKIIANAMLGLRTPEDPGYETNKKSGMVSVGVHPNFRNQGVAKHLLKMIVEKTKEYPDIEVLVAETNNEKEFGISEYYGGTVAITGAENRLSWNAVDWNLMEKWRDEGREKSKEYGSEIVQFSECPEEIIEEFMSMYSETAMQQPLGELDVEMQITPELRRELEAKYKSLGLE